MKLDISRMLPTKWMKPEDGGIHLPQSHPDAAVGRDRRAPQHACSHLFSLLGGGNAAPFPESKVLHATSSTNVQCRLPHTIMTGMLPAAGQIAEVVQALKIMINITS